MLAFDFFDPATVWINVANLALGLVTLICIGAVAWGVVSELFERSRARAADTADDHLVAFPGLGLTMADGGEKLEKKNGNRGGEPKA